MSSKYVMHENNSNLITHVALLSIIFVSQRSWPSPRGLVKIEYDSSGVREEQKRKTRSRKSVSFSLLPFVARRRGKYCVDGTTSLRTVVLPIGDVVKPSFFTRKKHYRRHATFSRPIRRCDDVHVGFAVYASRS